MPVALKLDIDGYSSTYESFTDSGAVQVAGLLSLACWDCGFESHQCGGLECFVLAGKNLCVELIASLEESYRLCVIMKPRK